MREHPQGFPKSSSRTRTLMTCYDERLPAAASLFHASSLRLQRHTFVVGNQRRVTNGSMCGIPRAMQPLFVVVAVLTLVRPAAAVEFLIVLLVFVRWLRSRRSRLMR